MQVARQAGLNYLGLSTTKKPIRSGQTLVAEPDLEGASIGVGCDRRRRSPDSSDLLLQESQQRPQCLENGPRQSEEAGNRASRLENRLGCE